MNGYPKIGSIVERNGRKGIVVDNVTRIGTFYICPYIQGPFFPLKQIRDFLASLGDEDPCKAELPNGLWLEWDDPEHLTQVEESALPVPEPRCWSRLLDEVSVEAVSLDDYLPENNRLP